MGFLNGKKILITGLLSKQSISYGIANACKREGADLAFTYSDNRIKRYIEKITNKFNTKLIFCCNVNYEKDIFSVFNSIKNHWDRLDGLVHSVCFAPKEVISGNFLDGITKKNFCLTYITSVYSFFSLVKYAIPILSNKSSLLTLSYIGSKKVIKNYNLMGSAKASLENSVKYLAISLGEKGIRVNAISSGPIKTLSSKNIEGFNKILDFTKNNSPIKSNVTLDQIGNTAAFLVSDLSLGITAEIIYVDNGFHAVANNYY